MVKSTLETRIRAIMLYTNGKKMLWTHVRCKIFLSVHSDDELAHTNPGIRGLQLKKLGPDGPTSSISRNLE
ncbi:MAG: hypothetical protein KGI11_08200 [Thaumarchaeota archaeon]|nr:hypothetical protein [Nitrososphaerota archaeon]